MAGKKAKLYRVQFLITKPATKYEKITGISEVLFISAYNENDIREYMNQTLLDIRKENDNDPEIYLKTLNIKLQRCSGTVNLTVKK